MHIDRIKIIRHKKGVVELDIRFNEKLNAEQIIEDQEINKIFKDYLHDKFLKEEVIKRVQGILDLIYNYRRKRDSSKTDVEKLKDDLLKEYRKKQAELTDQFYREV